jgi:hypothetical protein
MKRINPRRQGAAYSAITKERERDGGCWECPFVSILIQMSDDDTLKIFNNLSL